ncbi:MAG TPA: prepilin-type N-terminal cleavage/methylation domain-containing protein [Candidatus Saccharimonadales bacterium]|nr:prepilin-type N-terminal cleavage/methylation domain-containing protein [Candidatus Saccharimonadales bacterium]
MLQRLRKQRSDDDSIIAALRQRDGFTIIEVLIVLAIAGLIMVVVFLAVPALQRSGRNNALSTDANNVLTSVGNYSAGNGGTLPAGITFAAGPPPTVTIGAAGTNQEAPKLDNSVASVVLNGTVITNASAIGTIQIITGTTAVCNSTSTGLSGTGSPRSYAVLYVAEGSSGTNLLKCIGG